LVIFLKVRYIFTIVRTVESPRHHQHHHHRWLDSPNCALAFLRSFCQLKYPAVASSYFVTRVFSSVGLSPLAD
jgi:hypothetical protein